jgi:hypothetical protein
VRWRMVQLVDFELLGSVLVEVFREVMHETQA